MTSTGSLLVSDTGTGLSPDALVIGVVGEVIVMLPWMAPIWLELVFSAASAAGWLPRHAPDAARSSPLRSGPVSCSGCTSVLSSLNMASASPRTRFSCSVSVAVTERGSSALAARAE